MHSLLLGRYNPANKVNSFAMTGGTPLAERSLRVLVVEDNLVNCEIVSRMLDKRGHLVVSVNNGMHGVAEWQNGNYDVILMDIQMPIMDGPMATRLIRAEEKVRGGHIPIIAITAHAMKGTEKECLDHGMDGYVSKPLRKDSFLKTVESFARADFKSPAAKAKPAAAVAPYESPAKPNLVEKRAYNEPLIRLENMAQLVGGDMNLRRKVLNMCAEVLSVKMPQLNRAMSNSDRVAIQRLVHSLRGSLGMLGLPTLVKMGEDIECHYEVLGASAWQQRCEEFCALLRRIDEELRQLHAA